MPSERPDTAPSCVGANADASLFDQERIDTESLVVAAAGSPAAAAAQAGKQPGNRLCCNVAVAVVSLISCLVVIYGCSNLTPLQLLLLCLYISQHPAGTTALHEQHTLQSRCCSSRAGTPSRFQTEQADSAELLRLTPPFRVFKDKGFGTCDSDPTKFQYVYPGHYITRTATACAQACIAYNANVTSGSPYLCNSAVYKATFSYDAGGLTIAASPSAGRYQYWNCWIHVINNICGSAAPLGSTEVQGADLLVVVPDQSNCACAQL